jgi:hypothetical protein
MSSLVGTENGSRALYCNDPQAWKTSSAFCPCLSDKCKLFETEDPDRKTSFLYQERYDSGGRTKCPEKLELAICNATIEAGGNIDVGDKLSVQQKCGQQASTFSCNTELHACVPDPNSIKLLAQCNAECPKGGFTCGDSGKCAWSASAKDTQAECAAKCGGYACDSGKCVLSASAKDTQAECAAKCPQGGYACSKGQCAWSATAKATQAECAATCGADGGDAPPLSVGAIAGIASGGVVLLVIVGVLIYVFVIKKKAALSTAAAPLLK